MSVPGNHPLSPSTNRQPGFIEPPNRSGSSFPIPMGIPGHPSPALNGRVTTGASVLPDSSKRIPAGHREPASSSSQRGPVPAAVPASAVLVTVPLPAQSGAGRGAPLLVASAAPPAGTNQVRVPVGRRTSEQ